MLLGPVFPNQGVEVDLETVPRLVGCIVWVLAAKALNEHPGGGLVPWVGGRPLQVKFEVAGCAGELVTQWVVSICLVFGNLLRKCSVSRSAQEERGMFPDVVLNGY